MNREPDRVYPPPRWLGVLAWIFFALSILGGVIVVVQEFSSPHPLKKQTKPWLDR